MASDNPTQNSKDISLEAIRGLAAIVVVIWHCCLGFFPEHTGVFPQYDATSWQGSPFFFLMNGAAAVQLFFVLSGYVLTRRYFISGDNGILLKATIKRWPRLLGPVLVTVMVSYVFFKMGVYMFEPAGTVSGSPWLVKFAWAYDADPPAVSFWSAFKEGAFLTFFHGNKSYDSSLWTMQAELIGSFISFGIAPIFFEANKRRASWTIPLIVLGIALLAHAILGVWAFLIGTMIAALLPRDKIITPPWLAYGALLLALYLLGYSGKAVGAYMPFGWLARRSYSSMISAIAGAAILICLLETFPAFKKRLSGNISRWIGEFSFPVYLIHVLIVCSLGSAVYLNFGAIPAILSVSIATPFAAFPLLLFNRKWVAGINRMTARILD